MLKLGLMGLLVGSLLSCTKNEKTLLIFAAASFIDVLPDIGKEFEKEFGFKINYNFAGSNTLAQQILASSKADIFLSANESWMDEVESKGKAVKKSRINFVENSLVLIKNSKSNFKIEDIKELCEFKLDGITMANPESVPGGMYAKQWLSCFNCGEKNLWNVIQNKVVPGINVRTSLHYVESDSSMVGIVYKTDALSSNHVNVILEAKGPKKPIIKYTGALIEKKSISPGAKYYLKFLITKKASKYFEKHGFSIILDNP